MPNEYQNRIADLQAQIDDLRNEFYKNNFNTSQDFNKYSRFNHRLKVPVYSSAPAVAAIGDLYATAAGKLYVCTAVNTWTLVGSQT